MKTKNWDRSTLNSIITELRDAGYYDAAIGLSQEFIQAEREPQDWLANKYPNGFENKIRAIKELRREFDLGLKEAKHEADEYEKTL